VVDLARLEQLLELLRHVRGAKGDVQVPDAQHEDHGGAVCVCVSVSASSEGVALASREEKRGEIGVGFSFRENAKERETKKKA
jgi:hypothetical protein